VQAAGTDPSTSITHGPSRWCRRSIRLSTSGSNETSYDDIRATGGLNEYWYSRFGNLTVDAAVADSARHTYMLEMEEPNFGTAANGDTVTITGHADFSVHLKSATGAGTFTHTASDGTVRGTGTWSATDLIDYQSYGCGIVLGTPLPDNFCGGKVKLRVTLTTPQGQLPATLTVICIIGPNPPDSAFHEGKRSEGAMLNVPEVVNFNHTAGGDNVIIQTG
jgi:hypothetical protein